MNATRESFFFINRWKLSQVNEWDIVFSGESPGKFNRFDGLRLLARYPVATIG